ncbi:PAS domain S-box protein [bacterium]|nr:PAS domain S-box protein [bacterium]
MSENKPKRRKKSTKAGSKTTPKKSLSNPRKSKDGRSEVATPSPIRYPIIGVGASAGGLEAIKKLLDAMPEKPSVAIVVIQHLAPNMVSLEAELLARHTSMPVNQVVEDVPVEINRVYVIPPNKNLSISEGILRLSDLDPKREGRAPIDFFLRSLALDQQQRAVGIILSGTGSDGTQGVKAVKGVGGLVLAQAPETAEYPGMPRSAIKSGAVDHIVPVSAMPNILKHYAGHPYIRENIEESMLPVEESIQEKSPDEKDRPVTLDQILRELRVKTKRDFRGYRSATLVRRIRRRMCLLHIEGQNKYVEYLRQHPDEVDNLVKDLLISVTDFFRDPEAWQELRKDVIGPLVAKRLDDEPIRVWIPGCATGEEAYSMAMLLLEEIEARKKHCPLQIFASDIDIDALQVARLGRYPASISEQLTPKQLRRFFTVDDGMYYCVNKSLRESVVFCEQNVLAAPPFSKLDVISCRNLLIYLKPDIQEKVISLFHFGLVDHGILFLGSSETVGRQNNLFETVSKRWRIYRRIGAGKKQIVDLPMDPELSLINTSKSTPNAPQAELRIEQIAQRRLLDWLAPSAVLIDSKWKILHIYGDVDLYLSHQSGTPTDDLLAKARRGLRVLLRGIVQEAFESNHSIKKEGRVFHRSKGHGVHVTALPLSRRDSDGKFALVVFEAMDAPPESTAIETESGHLSDEDTSTLLQGLDDADQEVIVQQLEDELASTKEDLQSMIEQLQTVNEEYKAANEEAMSVNEELQSINEELEAGKEELQSLNEELTTVNSELGMKVEELEWQRSDMENLLTATDMPTICLDRDLCLRWFTPAAKRLFRMNATDTGRPLSDLTNDFVVPDLMTVAETVLNTLAPNESEVQCKDDRFFIRRITPYRDGEDRIGGLVVTFVDVTHLKSAKEQRLLLAKAVSHLGEGILITDAQLEWPGPRIWFVNESLCRITGYSEGELIGQTPRILQGHDTDNVTRKQIRSDLANGKSCTVELVNYRKNGEPYDAEMFITPIIDSAGECTNYVSVHRDISGRKQTERELARLAAIVESSNDAIISKGTDHLIKTWNKGATRVFGYSVEEVQGQPLTMLIASDHLGEFSRQLDRIRNHQLVETFETVCQRKDGKLIDVAMTLSPIRHSDGTTVGMSAISRDISDRKSLQRSIVEREQQLRAILNAAEESIITMNQSCIVTAVNPATERMFGITKDKIIGQNIKLLMPPPFCDEHDTYIARYLTTGERRVIGSVRELLGKRLDGTTFPIELTVSEVEHLGLFTGIIRDISDRKMLQREVVAAAEEEQRRIGIELHDSTQQELAGIGMFSQTLLEIIEDGMNRDSTESLSKACGLARKVLDGIERVHQEIQAISRGLVPLLQDAEGLTDALGSLATRSNQPETVACKFQCDPSIQIEDSMTATHLYRIAQEAVTNSLKHSQAKHVAISLKWEDGCPTLQIDDDGIGINPDEHSKGLGIKTMKYRANLIGAVLQISAKKSGGTSVVCKVLEGLSPKQ